MTTEANCVTRAAQIARLFVVAAENVDEALMLLDATAIPCECCEVMQMRNYDQARLREQFAETPTKLMQAAARVVNSVKADGTPSKSSKGFATSHARYAAARRQGVKR